MCGIAGYFGIKFSPQDQTLLHRMCEAIRHRGPDDDGFVSDDMAGFGMRRLSIIDLEGGHQPISNEDGNLWIVGNGEVYNFQPLRESLKGKGHRFTTGSDIEVILHLYEEEGPEALHQLNGMYAFAIWDKKQKKLFLGRDRMGIKPLYYYWDGEKLLFSSEMKALFASGLVPKNLNSHAIWDYLTLRYIPQPNSIWKDIQTLPAAHTLSISVGEKEPRIERYWDIPFESTIQPEKKMGEYTEEFSRLFLDAVRLHLISDVPIGVLLSGGLDSSAVAAAIKEVGSSRLDSFSVAFDGSSDIDERPFARHVAQHVGMNHHEITIGKKEFLDFLPKFVFYMDEPMADLASVPLYYVSHLAAKSVKVVMSGEGSDEVLGGYHFDQVVSRWEKVNSFQKWPAWMRQSIVGASQILGPAWHQRIGKFDLPINASLEKDPLVMTDFFQSHEKKRLFNDGFEAADSLDYARNMYKKNRNWVPLNQLLYATSQSWLIEDLLMKADRMTMANSIELRVPFLDYRLVEWAANVPSWVKVGRTDSGQMTTKRVLRDFAAPRLPKGILDRPKQGFPVPVYGWLKNELKGWATDTLLSPRSKMSQLFNQNEVRNILSAGTQGSSRLRDQHRLWHLLILELWLQEWKPN